MDPYLRQYYERRLAMMGDPAWKDLMDDVQKMHDATNTLSGVTADNLQFKQGELSIMRWMLSLKEVSEQSFEELKIEDHA